MKGRKIKYGFYILILVITSFSCEQLNNADYPGVSIYKTNGDYFYMVDIGMKGEKIFRRDWFLNDSSKIKVTSSDTVYNHRLRLINGYILDWEADERYDVFLNISFKKYIKLEAKCGSVCLANDTLIKYILDKSPYVEFYRETVFPKRFTKPDTSELNEIIRNGKIEEYFKRIK